MSWFDKYGKSENDSMGLIAAMILFGLAAWMFLGFGCYAWKCFLFG